MEKRRFIFETYLIIENLDMIKFVHIAGIFEPMMDVTDLNKIALKT